MRWPGRAGRLAGRCTERGLPPPLPLRQLGEEWGNGRSHRLLSHSAPHRDELGGGVSVSTACTRPFPDGVSRGPRIQAKDRASVIPTHSICIPASPPVDVGGCRSVIDHPCFQRLRGRKQLGINYLVFPGAVHTRFEHAIGCLGLTQRLCRIHGLPEEQRRLVCAFALLHDLGHGPFSHQIEPVIPGDHHERGLVYLDTMRGELRECGAAFEEIAAMFRDEHGLAQVVTDRNLGTDKLDYLQRDALHIGFTGAPDIEKIQFYTTFANDGLAIEEKFIEEIKRLQKFYSYLHQHGYLNKAALCAQRVLQRAVQEELAARPDGDPQALWSMTDEDLIWWLRHGRSPAARRLEARLATRRLHRTVLAIRPEGYGFVERCCGKPMRVLEWPRPPLRRFAEFCTDCGALFALEDRLATSCALPPGDLLVAPMPYFRKLLPQDVRLFSGSTGSSFGLFEKDRDHVRSLEGDYLRTFAVRVTVVPEERERVARQWERLAAVIQEACGSDAAGAAVSPG